MKKLKHILFLVTGAFFLINWVITPFPNIYTMFLGMLGTGFMAYSLATIGE